MNAIRTDNKLIIVSGCSGAGKETTDRLLSSALEPSAWIDLKSLGKFAPWDHEKYIAVSINNAAPLIDNFFKAGYAQVVLSSFVFSQSQRELDALVSLVQTECRMLFVWLDVDKTIRDKRRIGRARDGADKAEFLKFVDSVITDPGELKIPNGEYFRVQVDSETPHEVLERVVKSLAKEELALKGTRARNPANWCLPSTGKVPGSIPVKRHV